MTAPAARLRRLLAIDPLLFSWTQSFLIFNAAVLVMVVPASVTIRGAASTPGVAAFFPHVFALLLAIYAMNFGQTQGDPTRPWRLHWGYGRRLWLHALQLAVRLSALLLLSLPMWLVYGQLFYLRWTAAFALVYLWVQSQMWGWFGLWLSLTGFSEINQFKIKYLVLAGYFAVTLFLPAFSPFLSLQVLLDPNAFPAAAFQFFLANAICLVWMAVLGTAIAARARADRG